MNDLDFIHASQTENADGAADSDRGNSAVKARRILIADDSKFLRMCYAHHLRHSGFEVLVAEDGEAVIRLAHAEHPDMIVLDLLMPKLGGLETLQQLTNDPETANIPVLVLTGMSSLNGPRLVKSGAIAFFNKEEMPPEDLPARVSGLFSRPDARPSI